MKKLLALTLVCISLVNSLAFAETKTDPSIGMFQATQVPSAVLSEIPIPEKPPSAIIPSPSIPEPMLPIDYRSYTGKIVNDKNSKVTMQIYHMKRGNKDMFSYYIQYCTSSGGIGTCGFFSSYGWIEGKIAGQNWIIRDGKFNAVLGKNNGIINYGSIHAILKIE
jgi:hypothetical protein